MAPLASMESLSTTPDFSALPPGGGVGQVVGGAMSVVSGRKSAATVAPDAVSTSSMMVAHKTFEPPGLGKPSRVTPLGLEEGKLSSSDHKSARMDGFPSLLYTISNNTRTSHTMAQPCQDFW